MSYRGRRGQQKKHKIYKDEDVHVSHLSSKEESSPVVKLFQSYQVELDAKHDKYERLVKKSRDLTIESKRIIFLLHRVTSSGNKEEILNEAETRLSNAMTNIINGIALELCKQEVYQYIRAFSAGLQEYVEAVSFYHYLKNGSLVHIEQIYQPEFATKESEDINNENEYIKAELPLSAILNPTDFILGIADLTGELMRKCINSVGSGDLEEPFKLCYVLQNIYEAFLVNTTYSKELKRKLFILKSSLQKVETACYAIKIRGTETPKHMLADFFSTEDEFKEQVECDI